MRSISEAGLIKLVNKLGNESIAIIEIDWVSDVTVTNVTSVPETNGPVISAVTFGLNVSPPVITWSLTDPSGFRSTTLAIDGILATIVYGPYGTDTAASYSAVVKTPTAGDHTYLITATNATGGVSTLSGTFTVVRATSAYADKAVGNIPGKIVELSGLDDATSMSGGTSSSQLTVKLDDTDGTIKAIFDSHDPHKAPARVYQYFSGLDLSDRFLLFSGVLMSPMSWSERDRTVTLTIVSQLEDQECGWTTAESITGTLPDTIPNDSWPLIFGTVIENKAVRLRPPVSGTTLTPIGVLGGAEQMLTAPDDPGISFILSINKAISQATFLDGGAGNSGSSFSSGNLVAFYNTAAQNATTPAVAASYAATAAAYSAQANNIRLQVAVQQIEYGAKQQCTHNQRIAKLQEMQAQGYNGPMPEEVPTIPPGQLSPTPPETVTILGGETFPQGSVTVNINGAIFEGTMAGNQLTILSRKSDYLEMLAQGAFNNATNGLSIYPTPVSVEIPTAGGGYTTVTYNCRNLETVSSSWTWAAKIPVEPYDGAHWGTFTTPQETVTVTDNENIHNYDTILQTQWIEAGASVQVMNQDSLVYVASITPGKVTAVKALQNVSGVQLLVDVPAYTLGTTLAGKATAITVTLPQMLSTVAGEHWSDDLYITFESSVGPKVSDIIKYLVDTYSDLTCDPVSFAACACACPYTPNFALNSSRNVVSVLHEIAFQANCQLQVKDCVVYIVYLPQRPTAVDTITESDIDAENSVEVSLTLTEDLETRMTVNWSVLPVPTLESVNERSWSGTTYVNKLITGNDPGDLKHLPNLMILRNNVDRYGVHDTSYNFTIFNDEATVLSCAQFWLNRKSNTWKRIQFTTPLHKLNLETFDAVTLNFSQPYVASTPVLAIVESAKYDSASNCIHFSCITPVLAGTAKDCGFYWSN